MVLCYTGGQFLLVRRVTGVASSYYVCVLQGWPVPALCVTGVASAYAITLVIVSWILDPGIKNEAKHIKL